MGALIHVPHSPDPRSLRHQTQYPNATLDQRSPHLLLSSLSPASQPNHWILEAKNSQPQGPDRAMPRPWALPLGPWITGPLPQPIHFPQFRVPYPPIFTAGSTFQAPPSVSRHWTPSPSPLDSGSWKHKCSRVPHVDPTCPSY